MLIIIYNSIIVNLRDKTLIYYKIQKSIKIDHLQKQSIH